MLDGICTSYLFSFIPCLFFSAVYLSSHLRGFSDGL
jgi:hypothetical protein